MHPLLIHLEKAQTLAVRFGERLASDWREHANRRSVFLIAFLGALALALYVFFIAPPNYFPTGKLIAVPEGASAREIGELLKEQGVVRSGVAFSLATTLLGADRGVRAGDYIFKEPKDLFAVARAITTGAFGLEPVRIRIAEGATTAEMAEIFDAQLERFDAEAFLSLAQPHEGFLFPDTYFFLPNANETIVFDALRQNFDSTIVTLAGDIERSERSLTEVVIMASILEKEAFDYEDRRRIAGVLWRRLEIGMPLQVDAAFSYSIGRTTFDLTTKDLVNKEDPYNTYANKGLPPGAIGSPSLSALKAAVTPIDEGYLFYLADRNYDTHYSKTYEEHLRKKALYLGT